MIMNKSFSKKKFSTVEKREMNRDSHNKEIWVRGFEPPTPCTPCKLFCVFNHIRKNSSERVSRNKGTPLKLTKPWGKRFKLPLLKLAEHLLKIFRRPELIKKVEKRLKANKPKLLLDNKDSGLLPQNFLQESDSSR